MGRMETICRELGCEASEVFGMVLELVAATEELRAARVRAEQEVRAARAESWELMRAHLADEAVDMEFMEAAREFWLDDPWSVNKVLGVEVVKADNPYGCNQHAHSWVGQCPYDVPQPGDAWKPPVRKKDKPGGGKDGKKGKEEQQFKKEDEDKNLSGELVYSSLSKLFGKEIADKFETALKSAPEWLRNFYSRHINEAVKGVSATRGTSCHSFGEVRINKSDLKNTDYCTELHVLFHEIAHALDFKLTQEKGRFYGVAYVSGELHELIKEDYEEHVNRFNDEEVNRAKALVTKNPNITIKELYDKAYENGDMSKWHYDWHKDNPREEHLPVAYLKALGKRRTGKGRLTMTMFNGTMGLKRDVLKAGRRVDYIVCDAFRYKHGYDTGCGHDKTYYKKQGGRADAIETFAQLCAAYAQEDEKTIKEVEKLLPRTCKRFKEMIKEW